MAELITAIARCEISIVALLNRRVENPVTADQAVWIILVDQAIAIVVEAVGAILRGNYGCHDVRRLVQVLRNRILDTTQS